MRTGYYFTKYLSICHVKLLINKVKTHRLNSYTNKFYLFKNQVLFNCCLLPATLLAIADNLAGIWQQPCRHMPANKYIQFLKPTDTLSLTIQYISCSILKQQYPGYKDTQKHKLQVFKSIFE